MTPNPAILEELIRKHHFAVNGLTETQFADAIRQALPDFQRYVHKSGQQVVYLPGSEAEKWKRLYHELLWEVESKHEGESRHETALRYIQERERSAIDSANTQSSKQDAPTPPHGRASCFPEPPSVG